MSMGYGLKGAISRWDIEVEQEAERLIERGVPPYAAIEQAVKIVSRRRREQYREPLKSGRQG